ncbi:MAG: zinc ABC transporter substrate-binding protein [Chloroflexi bacterium]|nr:zinc ABC transporter substrate-binding protein [Chloroflexota bacterium]MBA3586171.1 zinc ABC transporter substrate-binding protein [Chloroflexota bacterium]
MVVTYSVLGAVVTELVGDRATVTVLMGNGVDPHDWAPSARDIETVMNADLVVANGLDLEEGLIDVLERAEGDGVPVFHATDHIAVHELGEDGHGDEDELGEDEPGDDHEGGDPHFWVDPLSMHDVVTALAVALDDVGVDVADRSMDLEARLTELDAETRTTLDAVPADGRKLITGHESMDYFADRYDFTLIGAVVPGLSSQGEVSAGELAALKAEIIEEGVPAIFTEVGTPAAVVEAIGQETGVNVVELPSHLLPDDGSYFSFIRAISSAIAGALG